MTVAQKLRGDSCKGNLALTQIDGVPTPHTNDSNTTDKVLQIDVHPPRTDVTIRYVKCREAERDIFRPKRMNWTRTRRVDRHQDDQLEDFRLCVGLSSPRLEGPFQPNKHRGTRCHWRKAAEA